MNKKDFVNQAAERSNKNYEHFAEEFEAKIANGNPAAGTTRMDALETLLLNLHRAQRQSDIQLAQDLTEALDDKEIVAAKKASS